MLFQSLSSEYKNKSINIARRFGVSGDDPDNDDDNDDADVDAAVDENSEESVYHT